MLAGNSRLVADRACALWEQGSLTELMSLCIDDVVFAVPSSPQAASFLGEGTGRDEFGRRLELLLGHIEVLNFEPVSSMSDGLWHVNRVVYRYRHRSSRLVIAGSMRQRFAFVGDK